VTRADVGHVSAAAPCESDSHSEGKGDSAPLIVLEVISEGKSLRAMVDSGATNNFVRRGSLPMLQFEEKKSPRSDLVIRLATGASLTVRKRVVTARFRYEKRVFREDLVVLDLDDKYDMILGMPWLRRHAPTIDWVTQSIRSFGSERDRAFTVSSIATESDGPVSISAAPICADVRREGVTESASPVDPSRHNTDHAARSSERVMKKILSVQGTESRRRAPGPRPAPPRTRGPSNHKIPSLRRSEGTEIPPLSVDRVDTQAPGAPQAGLEKEDEGQRDADRVRVRAGSEQPPRDYKRDVRAINALTQTCTGVECSVIEVEQPPSTASELTALPAMSWKKFSRGLREGTLEQVCIISEEEMTIDVTKKVEELHQLLVEAAPGEDSPSAKTKRERFEEQSWSSLKSSPFYDVLREYADVFPDEVPAELPQDKGTQHEIDLVPGTKYCVTRQWPLPRDQVKAIDEFFEARRKAGQVRESTSPHSAPTFCVKKAQGGWRIVHAFNKLNDATVPAQTPIPRKDVIIDSMTGSTIFSTLDLRDGFYQILMREQDIPLTAVSTPSGMLWEWLVMPQGLKNAPATFNRCVTHLLRSVREFAPSYFDDVYIHSRAVGDKSEVDMHREHLRSLLVLMRQHKLYANLKKCIFGASEIPVLGCLVGRSGVRPDPEKIKVISEWPAPTNAKELRQFLGLATYLCKYVSNYAERIRPLSQLLKKDITWAWTPTCQAAFDAVKQGLTEAPVLAIADPDRPFHVVCDASDFAIGCALMQRAHDDRERVICYQSRQLKPAERNYPVHDKELLAMKYALAKFRVYLLGDRPFVIFTDHASLRTAVKTPHLSQRMARWLSFFAEYNFRVEYKPGRQNVVADALSRRPDYAVRTSEVNAVSAKRAQRPLSSLTDEIKRAYALDTDARELLAHAETPTPASLKALPPHLRARAHRYTVHEGLLLYRDTDGNAQRIVVPEDEDLKLRILFEYHDAPLAGHLGREKTYLLLARDFYWPRQYKWVRKYVRACEVCQRVKPAPVTQAPLASLPIASECWESVSMDFVFGLPPDAKRRTGVVVFVDRFSKMVHLAAVPKTITGAQTARLFIDIVFRSHGMPREIVSDRDPRFVGRFWQEAFRLLGTQLSMSTTDHPQTDGQTERVNRVLGDVLKSYAHSFTDWNECLPMAEFAINNSVHVSHGHTPFFVNAMRHPRLPSVLGVLPPTLSGGGRADSCEESARERVPLVKSTLATTSTRAGARVSDDPASKAFIERRQTVIRFVQDALAASVDRQKLNADKRGRGNVSEFKVNSLVLLSTANLPKHAVSDFGASKLAPRFIGPFTVLARRGTAYTLDIPSSMRLHPTFYVGRLKAYHQWSNAEDSDGVLARDDGPTPSQSPGSKESSGCDDAASSPSDDSSARSQQRGALPPPHPNACGDAGNSQGAPSATCRVSRTSSRGSNAPARPRQSRGRDARSPPREPRSSQEGLEDPSCPTTDKSSRGIFPPPPPPLRDAAGATRWIVERIVAHRSAERTRGPTHFRIRWRGYTPLQDTWEPRNALLEDVPDLVRAYEAQHC
jgi:hypothetical protein